MNIELIKAIKRKLNVGETGSVPQMMELETLLLKDLELEKFTEKLTRFIQDEMPADKLVGLPELIKIDDFVKRFYFEKLKEVDLWVVRGFVVGKLIEERERFPQRQILEFNKMPEKLKEAIHDFNLTEREIKALNYTLSHGAEHLVSATNATVTEVQRIVFDGISKRKTKREIRADLEDSFLTDEGEVNRNWKRVAIHESNNAFNQGYLAQLGTGTFLLGLSLPDRCDHCGKLIDGKIYPLISDNFEQTYGHLDKEEAEYKKRAFLWENAVWLSKDNVGRSSSRRRRINVDGGNAEDNLVDREHYEQTMPCIPLHVYCRCRWVRINIATQYVADGKLRMKFQDPQAYERWYTKNVLPLMEKFAKFGVEVGRKQ